MPCYTKYVVQADQIQLNVDMMNANPRKREFASHENMQRLQYGT